jgi:iron complex transport system ATP-binding protein
MIKVKDLSFGYQDYIFQSLNFELNTKGFTSIIGPNGAGKTTLLKLLSKNINTYKGEIIVSEQSLRDIKISDFAKVRAFVASKENIEDDFLSVYEYISFGRLPYQNFLGSLNQKDRAIISESINLTKVESLLDKNINHLSSGERQRVQIARALAQEPSILLLDEPTAHLDIKYQIEVLSLLKNISDSGVKVISILHDLNLASYYSDYIIMLSHGGLKAFGSPEDVFTHNNLESVFENKWEIFKAANGKLKVFPILI